MTRSLGSPHARQRSIESQDKNWGRDFLVTCNVHCETYATVCLWSLTQCTIILTTSSPRQGQRQEKISRASHVSQPWLSKNNNIYSSDTAHFPPTTHLPLAEPGKSKSSSKDSISIAWRHNKKYQIFLPSPLCRLVLKMSWRDNQSVRSLFKRITIPYFVLFTINWQELGSEVHLWQSSVHNNAKLWKFIKHDLKSSPRLMQKVLVYFHQLRVRRLIDTSNCGSPELPVILSHLNNNPSHQTRYSHKLSQHHARSRLANIFSIQFNWMSQVSSAEILISIGHRSRIWYAWNRICR